MRTLLVAGVVVVALTSVVSGQGRFTLVQERGSLARMTRMSVLIERDADLEALGMEYSRLQSSIELRLRQTGITVIEAKDNEELLQPYLYVNPTCVHRQDLLACNVGVDFKQLLEYTKSESGKPAKVGRASTWNDGTVLLQRGAKPSDVIETINDVLDTFLNDYLAENPRR